MPTCPKCGAETEKDDEFCRSYGSRLAAETSEPLEKESPAQEREVCFEGERRRDYSGLISFGVFLLIVGIIFLANPTLISDFNSWVKKLSTDKTISRPPLTLINSATLFFGLIGISDFFLAGVRFTAHQRLRRVLTNILSGVALVLFSYFIYLYGGRTLSWQMVLAAEAVTVGLLIILYSVLHYLFPKKL
jgi:uncharacterized membrane protein YvbJ